MKRFILIFFAIFLNTLVFCQLHSLQKVDTYGDGIGDDDEALAVTTDNSGNIYVIGKGGGILDFDPSPQKMILSSNTTTEHIYLACYDSNLQVQWAKRLTGSSSGNEGRQIAIDGNGDILICGSFVGEIDFDPSSNNLIMNSFTYNNGDAFVAKYSNQGSLIWAAQLGGNSVDGATSLGIDGANNIYVAGAFSDSADFDPGIGVSWGIATGTFQDPFVVKLNSNGQYLWSFTLPGSGLPGWVSDMDVKNDGSFVVAGQFSNSIDADPSSSTQTLTSAGNTDVFLIEYDQNGNHIRSTSFGGIYEDLLVGLERQSSGNIFLTGTFMYSTDLQPGAGNSPITSSGNKDIFLAKYTPTFNLVWGFGMGSSSADYPYHLSSDNQENLFICGYIFSGFDMDPSAATFTLTPVSGDGFIASYDSTGAFDWAFSTQGISTEKINSTFIQNNKIIAVGSITKTVDMDLGQDSSFAYAYNNSSSSVVVIYDKSNNSYQNHSYVVDHLGGDDDAKIVIHDQSGNYYVGGSIKGEVSFDAQNQNNTIDAGEFTSGFIAKYNSSGGLIWSKVFSGTGNSFINSLTIDYQGNILAGGSFYETIDLDIGTNTQLETSAGLNDAMIVKLNPAGDFIWGIKFGGSNNDDIYELASDSYGSVVATGYFRSTADFDPSTAVFSLSAAVRDAFLAKFSTSGIFQWAFKIGGSSSDYGNSVQILPDNKIIAGGLFRNTADFDPSTNTVNLVSTGGNDGYLAIYDENGNLFQAQQYGGLSDDQINKVKIKDNKVYATGNFRLTADFDPSSAALPLTSNGDYDIFVFKADTNLNTIWARSFGSNGQSGKGDYVTSLFIEDSLLILSGYFYDTIDFDPGIPLVSPINNGYSDGFINYLDTSGNYIENHFFGGPSTDWTNSISIKNGQVVAVGSFTSYSNFDFNGTIVQKTAAGGKDIAVLHLGPAIPCSNQYDTVVASACDFFELPSGKIVYQSGNYIDTVSFGFNCDSIIQFNLTINQSFKDTIIAHGCYSYFDSMANVNISQEGFYSRNFQTINGCDSVIILQVLLDTSSSKTYATSCDSFSWRGKTYLTSGTYFDTIPNSLNCDSLLILELTISNSTTSIIQPVACGSYLSPSGKTLTQSGNYLDTIPNQAGCDSVITIQLTVNQATTSTIQPVACGSYLSPSGKTLNQSGTYLDTIPNHAGCDSVITIQLTVNQATTSTIQPVACGSYLSPSGKTLTQSGTYLDTIPNQAGCDSVITIQLTVNQATTSTIQPVACGSYLSPSGKTLTQSGIYFDTIPNQAGCDSVITIQLTVNQATTSTIQPVACWSYLSPSGKTLTQSGTYLDTIPNHAGCDSVITIQLTVNQATTSTIQPVVCGFYLSPSGKTLTQSGTYLDTIPNQAGCDSMITIQLTVNQATTSTIQPVVCGSYLSPSGKTLTQSGTYLDTIPNQAGCDSVITIQLTVNQATTSTIQPVACGSYLSPSGKTLTQSGNYLDTIPNQAGCDSVITIQLTVIVIDNTISYSSPVLSANHIGGNYQWINCSSMMPISGATSANFTVTANGYYAVIITDNICVDTSACYPVSDLSIQEKSDHFVSIFPNPSRHEFTILFSENQSDILLDIFSADGKIVYSEHFSNISKYQINHNFAPGLYRIIIRNSSNQTVQKNLIIQ